MNRSISKGRSALVMGLALITASLLLIASFANANIIGLALQNTETPTGTVEATTEPTTEATADASATPGTDVTAVPAATGAVGACVDLATTSTDATAEATPEASATTEATTEATAASVDATATGPTSYLGVVVTAVADCGVRVLEVFADSPAFTAELAVGDVIVAVNGVPLTQLTTTQSAMGTMNYASMTTAGFFAALHALAPGDVVTLTVQRTDGNVDVMVTLGELAAGAPSTDFEGTLVPSVDPTSTPEAVTTLEPTLEATVEATP